MADWSKPALSSTYTDFLTELKARDTDNATQFSTGTPTNVPASAIKWDAAANRWKKWNGSAWAELTSAYDFNNALIGSNQILHAANYNNYSPTKTGGGASGTWSINVTGSASYATSAGSATSSTTAETLSGSQADWATLRSNAVANMLGWRNYGNGHVIFDASSSLSPSGTTVNNTNAATAWSPTYPTLMAWNGSTTYGVRVDSARLADNGGVTSVNGLTGAVTVQMFPAGTFMLFQQTAAPTGWTKQTTHDNKALRVVSGTAGSGGTTAFTTVFSNQTVTTSVSVSGSTGATTLSIAQMPSHTHNVTQAGSQTGSRYSEPGYSAEPYGTTTGATGGGGSHSHSFSGSGSGTSSAITLNVQYVDLIIARKD